ncbi:MAG: hypothetical protein ACRDRV_04475 [Pseudonocardiaceae bacterium]
MAGYLLTRLYLPRAFTNSDRISETVVSSVAIYAGRLEAAAVQLFSLPSEYSQSDEKIITLGNREALGKISRPSEKVRDLGGFRSEMNILLDRLIGAKSHHIDSVKDKIDTLRQRGVLDKSSSRALHDIAIVTDLATEESELPVSSDKTLGNAVQKILDQLAKLQELTASRFEYHVLSTLNRNLPTDWSIQSDVRISHGQFQAATATDEKPPEVSEQVDALISDSSGQSVVVEVRSRIESIGGDQLKSLQSWLTMIPSDVAVIIVIPDGDVRREHLTQDRRRRLHVLDWDTKSDLLMSTIHESFMVPAINR